MKKILVPVDFSPCSMDALVYAKALAKELSFSLKVVNVSRGLSGSSETKVSKAGKTQDETSDKRLKEFVEKVLNPKNKAGGLTKNKVEMSTEISLDIINHLVKITKDPEVALVVIGTRGKHNVAEKMFGSTASSLAQRAHCPVFLIPEGVKYKEFEGVLYASNFESADEEMLDQVIDFGNVFRATMHFVHVEESDNYENVEDTIFNKLFEEGDPAFSFNIVNIKNPSVIGGLTQYAEENEVDLIVLVNRHRKFVDNVLQLSLTQKMALNTKLPLMVFHILNE